MKPGEWAFSLERLFSSCRLHLQELFPKTDSKGILWRVFAYFRLAAKVSARPGTRGKPAPAETHKKSTAGKPAPAKTRGEAAQKTPSQRERSENARRQTGQ